MEGFVEIFPKLDHSRVCPKCQQTIDAIDWAITGLWTLGFYHCQPCGRHYWVDLPYNLGVLSPCYLCIEDATVIRPGGPDWYANLTLAGWQSKVKAPVTIERRVRKSFSRICLVNALGNCWGDAIATFAKLNALKHLTEIGVIVLTTGNLLPHLPEFVAEAWVVSDYTHVDTAKWNESLASALKSEVAKYEYCCVPIVFQLPTVSQDELAALSGVQPFDRTRWDERLNCAATVTFMWRDDRCWANEPGIDHWMNSGLAYRRGVGRLIRYWRRFNAYRAPYVQARRVNAVARLLKRALPNLNFAVSGMGSKGRFAPGIADLRTNASGPAENQAWCVRASHSHILIGVLGSHMVLPAGHAGGVVDLMPSHFFRNVLTDLLVTTSDKRESLFLYRTLPLATGAAAVAELVISMLVNYSCANASLNGDFYLPLSNEDCERLHATNAKRVESVERVLAPRFRSLMGP